jgi:hypothetical protein
LDLLMMEINQARNVRQQFFKLYISSSRKLLILIYFEIF